MSTIYNVGARRASLVAGAQNALSPESIGAAPFWTPVGAAEPFPRWATTTAGAPTAQNVYLSRLHLQVRAYTTVTFGIGGTQGVTLANTYFGIYNVTTLAKLAESADVSATVAAVAANTTGTAALAYTPAAEADVWMAFLIGSAATMPTVVRCGTPPITGMATLAPSWSNRHTSAETALPATVTLSNSAVLNFWFRYE